MEKASEFQENIYFCFIDYAKAFDCVDHNKLWKVLREMGITDHLICLLKNLYAGQEATVRTGHGTTDWFQIGKEFVKAVYCHPAYLTSMKSTSCKMLGWMKHKWNQDCQEKYQEPQICRWYHSNGRKQRGRDSLVERGEWNRRVKKLT